MEKRKDKYACFQWIRNVRAEMNRDMENMTWEERFDYLNARYEKAREGQPQYTLAESNELLKQYLGKPKAKPEQPEPKKAKSTKSRAPAAKAAKTPRKPAPRRTGAKRLTHA